MIPVVASRVRPLGRLFAPTTEYVSAAPAKPLPVSFAVGVMGLFTTVEMVWLAGLRAPHVVMVTQAVALPPFASVTVTR